MDYHEASAFTLSLLRDKKRITYSELLEHMGGDELLLKRVSQELILQEFAEDYKNVGLRLTRSESSYFPQTQDINNHTIPEVPHKNIRIFISYGRKGRGLSLAERLEHDLARRGYDVYRDLNPDRGLKGGYDWEWELEKQIEARNVFLSVLTCYAVRKPDGYCLDEISLARALQKKIIPLLVENTLNKKICRPPLCIHRLNFIDFQQWEDEYDDRFAELLRAIHAPQQYEGLSIVLLSQGGDQKAIDYDFTGEISRKAKNFSGRAWLVERVNSWLHDSKEQVFFLIGDPGSGKSAFIACLSLTHPEAKAVHFFIRSWDATRKPRSFLCSLASMIAFHIPAYRETIKPILNTPGFFQRSTGDLLWDLIINPLGQLGSDHQNPIFIMLDAIDESIEYNKSEILNLLVEGIREKRIPPWIRFLITSRPVPLVMSAFRGFPVFNISHDEAEENIEDMKRYLREVLGSKSFKNDLKKHNVKVKKEQLLESLIVRSEGNFLYLRLVLEDIRKGLINPFRPEFFPSGLPEYYTRNFERLFPEISKYHRGCRRVLDIIVTAKEPLTLNQISEIIRKTPVSVSKMLEPVIPFLEMVGDSENPRFRPFHASFTDWITGEKAGFKESFKFQVDVISGHQKIASYLMEQYKAGINSRFVLAYLPSHLFQARRFQEYSDLLFDFRFINEKVSRSDLGIQSLIEDYQWMEHESDIKNHIPEKTQKALKLVCGALELSSHVLRKDPGQLKSQITGRLLGFNEKSIQDLLSQIALFEGNEWLCPLTPSLTPPGGPLIRILEGHTDKVWSVAVTPDGKKVLSASMDTTLRLWDLESGECLQILTGHTSHVEAVAISSDGKFAVSGSRDNTLRLWDLESGECLKILIGHTKSVETVVLSKDDRFAISGSEDKTIRVWDLKTGLCNKILIGHTSYVQAISIMKNNNFIVSCSHDQTLRLWDLEKEKCIKVFHGHKLTVFAVKVTLDSRYVVSASSDHTLMIWDLEGGRQLHNPDYFLSEVEMTLEGHSDSVETVSLTPDGKKIVSGSYDKTIRIWDIKTRKCERILYGHTESVKSVVITPDGSRIISGSWDNSIRVWDIKNFPPYETRSAHEDMIFNICITPDGAKAVSASADKTLRIWNIQNGQLIHCLETHVGSKNAIEITTDGTKLISGSFDNLLQIWDIESGKCINTLHGHSSEIHCLVLMPDDKRVISGSKDATLRIWDIKTGKCLKILKGHDSLIFCVMVTSDGQKIISLSYDRSIRIWDSNSGKCLQEIRGPTHNSPKWVSEITPDNRKIISGTSGNTIQVWDIEDGKSLNILKGHTKSIFSLIITRDGQRVISGSADNKIKVWDIEDGRCLHTYDKHSGPIYSLKLFPNERRFISGSWDNTLNVWNFLTGDLIASFQAENPIVACDYSQPLDTILIGDSAGQIYFLKIEK